MRRYKEFQTEDLGTVVLDRAAGVWGIWVERPDDPRPSPDGKGVRAERRREFFSLEDADGDDRIPDGEQLRARKLFAEMHVNPPCNIWEEKEEWATQGPLVVTRHPALVDLLIERRMIDPGTEVKTHVQAHEVQGRVVIGVLPLSLAALAKKVIEIPLALEQEDRGKELPLIRLRKIAGRAVAYKVTQTLLGR